MTTSNNELTELATQGSSLRLSGFCVDRDRYFGSGTVGTV